MTLPDQRSTTTAGARPGAPSGAGRPVRFGVHGSSHLAAGIVAAAGHRPEEVVYVPYDVRDPFAQLRSGEADIMIVKFVLREPDIALSAPVAHDDRAVLVGAGHTLAGRSEVSVEEVADYEAFSRPGDFPPYIWDEVVPPVTPGGRRIRRAHPLTTVEAMVELVSGDRVVHLSVRSLDTVVPPHIRVVPVRDLPPAPVSLAWLAGTPLPPAAARLVADAERAAAR
ncbi:MULTISPECIES: LysR substrate-binding domain-containing protein [Streptomycetaceae]|uniref:Transcriptional regulator, LysR family n=1 Tax=Streptantibioticus cattleyicolor (strain ATCC 35852 / DSM 46488 / JCM 4925 / NBRC 14057 / NRRL 8057) TaxID=1003195 RepID=F8JS79_STREN|nr:MULTISPECIES: LysR substrate-binding domain-containing protein [Streptomycetaceae]AEW94190.1 transcriptional regulator, LysR family [Streptantibioticus cattleyicolor NRRL 8057 = DSM 46488]MYS58850.1 LysR family transcriptional regulator [Streptomyces sp. SID5468]CCB74544.1 protein of unknown function [Streptantibioticus cattleyicolor NRRL 8057 = DSM 46488]